jgi:hypothetical protein
VESSWTEEASDSMLATGEGVLGIGIGSYGQVKGELAILKVPGEPDHTSFDHIAEASLNIASGVLQVFPCIEFTPVIEIRLDPGTYRVRLHSRNLNTARFDRGDEFYIIHIWPGKYSARKVLRQYRER